MLENPIHHMSALDQVMAWWEHAKSHYMSQRWPRSLSPFGITRPQQVNQRNFWALGKVDVVLKVLSWVIFLIHSKSIGSGMCWNIFQRWKSNIGSNNGMVPSGTKSLPDPTLAEIYSAIWCHQTTMAFGAGWNFLLSCSLLGYHKLFMISSLASSRLSIFFLFVIPVLH